MRAEYVAPIFVLLLSYGEASQQSCEPIEPSTYPLNMEMREVPNPFTRNVYGCEVCTRADFDAIVAPEGWEKNVPNRILSTQNSLERFEAQGVPSSVSFSDEIPGNEWELIAILEGVAFDTGAPVATVRRNTIFTFPSCSRMHRLQDEIEKQKLPSRMVLTVHDELVFESPPEEREGLVVDHMQNAVPLSVPLPLPVDVGWGPNWGAAH